MTISTNREPPEVSGSRIVTADTAPLNNLGFEFGDVDADRPTTPKGWTFHGNGEQGGVFSDIVARDSDYNSTQSFGSPYKRNPLTENPMGDWAIRKTYSVGSGGEILTLRAKARILGTIPDSPSYTEGSQTIVGEDDAFIEVRCYETDGSQSSLSASEQYSETALHQLYERTGRTGDTDGFEWQPITHEITVPSGTDYIVIELVAVGGNNSVESLGFRSGDGGILFDDVRFEYPTGMVSNSSNLDDHASDPDAHHSPPYLNALDYSGANGGEQIRAAINDLPTQGGSVFIPPVGPDTNGEWHLTAKVEIERDNVHVFGVPGATTIVSTANSAGFKLGTGSIADATTRYKNLSLEGIVYDAGGFSDGSYLQAQKIDNVTIRDVICGGNGRYALNLRACTDGLVENCVATGAQDDNFTVTDTGQGESLSRDITFRDCVSEGGNQSQYEVDDGPHRVTFVDCVARGGQNGYMSHTHGGTTPEGPPKNISYVRCKAYNPEYGFRFGPNRSGTPEDYHVYSPVVEGATVTAMSMNVTDDTGANVTAHNITMTDPDITHTGSYAAIAFDAADGVAGGGVRGGHIDASGVPAITINSASSDIHINNVTLDSGGINDNASDTIRGYYEGTNKTAVKAHYLGGNTSDGTAQTISSGTWTVVNTTDLPLDKRGEYDLGTDTWTADTAGTYSVGGAVLWPASTPSGTACRAGVFHNGSPAFNDFVTANGSTVFTTAASGVIDAAAGDTVTLQARQNSGGGVDLVGGVANTYLTVQRE